ncbi:aminoglycoside phosphotransferase [Streptomyces sp. HUAS TT7]|uniref:aminoglycoside phosphotransferase n=1 Tax=Streptomyces sp. HUAS TT7 TaxID=3447507 RepID=UPI003F65EC74
MPADADSTPRRPPSNPPPGRPPSGPTGPDKNPPVPPNPPFAHAELRVGRRPYSELPEPVRQAVEVQVGADCPHTDMVTGDSSGVAVLFFLPDGQKVFVKGLPADHERAPELEAEATVNPLLPSAFAPRLLWDLSAGGWRLLGFQGVTASPWSDFTADSSHLEPVAAVLRELSTLPAPDIALMTPWDRWGSYCDPDDEPLLTGPNLLHTDPVSANFLVEGDGFRAWLIDWAWAARGPGWIDAALWGLRLVVDGQQTPEQARAWALTIPAFAEAPPDGVRVLTGAEARSWEHWQAQGATGLDRTIRGARLWASLWA